MERDALGRRVLRCVRCTKRTGPYSCPFCGARPLCLKCTCSCPTVRAFQDQKRKASAAPSGKARG